MLLLSVTKCYYGISDFTSNFLNDTLYSLNIKAMQMISKQKEIIDDILVIYKHETCAVCNKIVSILDQLSFSHEKKLRSNVTDADFDKKRLAIVVAGDGTILRTCQHIRNDSMLLGVNNNPKSTEGFLTRATVADFKSKFQKIISGKAKCIQLPRLEVRINGDVLPYVALNEVSISRKEPYHTFVHELAGNVEKASGILVSTPIGSTAWSKSAGGKQMPLASTKMQFVIREPYAGKIYHVKKRSGVVDHFKVKALCNGIIVFDSISMEFPFNEEDIIEVSFSKYKLNFLAP